MFKKVCSLLLATSMIAGLGCTLTANAAENEKSKHTPDVSALTLKSDNNVSRFFNAEGEEVDLSALNSSSFLRRRVMVPSKYDLRDEGRSTSVKNQGSEGFCWSFASNASMESNIITQKLNDATDDEIDLSESGGAWFSCNSTTDKSDPTYGDHRDDPNNGATGGNALDAAESLSSGYGAYPEELAMYDDRDGYSEGLRYYSDYRLKDFTYFPEDFNLIKQRIMEKGAVYYAYKSFEENYFTTEDGTMTYSDNGLSVSGEATEGGHAITVIGWDDNFSKDNFHPDAGVTNDGAWLCKNSWGENWGNDGYFWASYESFVYEIGQFEMQDKDSFDTIHQHQTSSEQYIFGGNDEENPEYFSSANVFTAETAEELEQICYSNAIDSNVKVKIYELEEGYTSPVDGKLLAEFDSDVKYAGTHCVDVPGNITFNEGDIFSVVIEGDTLMTNFRYEDDENPTNDKAGKSYFTENGTDWTDVADYEFASYAAIKAYTTKMAVDKSELTNLVKSVKEYKPANEGEQALFGNYFSELNPYLEKAEKLLADENLTNTDLKNFCCILKTQWDAFKMESFTVNNPDDFKILCEGLRSGEFNNRYVEFNTDIDLSDFDKKTSDDSMNGLSELFSITSGLYLDGKGHTISNFDDLNLLGNLENSTIKNLNIENGNVEGGILYTSLLAGIAVDTRFININVKNSTINGSESSNAALLAGVVSDCTFMDCNAENCKIIGFESETGLFFIDAVGGDSSEVINCKAENYTLYTSFYATDNMGFSCTNQSYCAPSIKITDDDCVIEPFLGNVKSIKVNGVEITPVGSEYHIDKTNGSVNLDIESDLDESMDFCVLGDLENRIVKVSGYHGTDTDIVIPEEVFGCDVVGLSDQFFISDTNSYIVNSITVPGVIKSVPDGCFGFLHDLKKIILEEGVEEIGANAFEYDVKLTEITLPDSIRTIGENAFINCGAESVTLGKNIQSIGDYAFGYCETESGMEPVEGFTIYGYSGTAAETYANENGFNFVDLNG